MRRLRRLLCEYTTVASTKKLTVDATRLLDFLRRCNKKSGRSRFDSRQLADWKGGLLGTEREIRSRLYELEARGIGHVTPIGYNTYFDLLDIS